MKILVWIGCVFVYAFATTLLKAGGITIGAIPTVFLVGGMFWLGRTICSKLNDREDAEELLEKASEQKKQTTIEPPVGELNKIRFCRKCGERLIDNSQFCHRCGAEITKE